MRFAAIVLAGGQSTRMGRDKAWLRAVDAGPTLLERALTLAHGLDEAGPVIVGARPGQKLPPLPAFAQRVDDPPGPSGGPMISIAACLHALVDLNATNDSQRDQIEWAHLSTCDEVALSADHLRARCAMATQAAPETWALVGVDDSGHPQPLSCMLRVAPAAELARAALEQQQRAPRRWLTHARARVVTDPSFGHAHDVDTPAAWASWLAAQT